VTTKAIKLARNASRGINSLEQIYRRRDSLNLVPAMSPIELQSEQHRQLLDIIDRLRSKGISKYVDLPEIVVCGDQSAGKSSVLEAISGMSFPTKDNLCTRFATELVLRRAQNETVKISITAGPNRTERERQRLSEFDFDFEHETPDLSNVVEKAKEIMGLSDTKRFSTDILRVELCGPDQPHLTMVDLPGLFRAGNQDQSVEDADTVRNMVVGYMEKPRSIILAVVSAKSDFALQEVTELARNLDPEGMRTIGLITKPDTLDPGSDSENSYVKLARNKDVVFRLGWHVLRNRSYETRDATSVARDKTEQTFFATGAWTSIDASSLGAKPLKIRLSNILKDQILLQLPGLLEDVSVGITASHSLLEQLGSSRSALRDQRRYLLQVSHDLSALIKSAVDGMYNDRFFGNAMTNTGYQRRLRAVVQNTLTDFEETMREEGQARIIVENSQKEILGPREIFRSDYLEEVTQLMRRSRGCELPGTFNPLIIGELFAEQCKPWKRHVTKAKEDVIEATYDAVTAIVEHSTVSDTTDGILRIINRGIDALRLDLDDKVSQLLDPFCSVHPITYNHYLIDSVQKTQSERRRKSFKLALESRLGTDDLQNITQCYLPPSQLLDVLDRSAETDMERYASNSAVDYMQAYYKVCCPHYKESTGD
jgi:GTP-binding protein EngB required for normal cell division